MSLGNLKKSFPLFALLCACVLSVSLRLHYSSNKIDPVLQDMYTQKAQYETLLSQQITENKKIEALLQSGRLAEQQYRSQKDEIQNKINEYIHSNTGTAEVFPTNRNVQKLPSPTTIKKPNIKEQELKQELGLLRE